MRTWLHPPLHSVADYVPCAGLRMPGVFCNCQFVLLRVFAFSNHLLTPFSPGSCPCVLWVCKFVSAWCVHVFRPLDSTNQWDHILLAFLCRTHCTEHHTLRVHASENDNISFSLRPRNIPPCTSTTSFGSAQPLTGRWAAYASRGWQMLLR